MVNLQKVQIWLIGYSTTVDTYVTINLKALFKGYSESLASHPLKPFVPLPVF
jgi:hypothetical protein